MGASQAFTVTALAAGAVSGNILAGSMFELVGDRPRAIKVWAIQDPGADSTHQGMQMRITYGTVTAVEDGYPLQIATANGVGPNKSDHEVVSFLAHPRDRIVVNLRNAGAGTSTARVLVAHQDF